MESEITTLLYGRQAFEASATARGLAKHQASPKSEVQSLSSSRKELNGIRVLVVDSIYKEADRLAEKLLGWGARLRDS